MTTTIEPQDLEGLLAAHALGALDDTERAAVERVLEGDPTARSQLAGFTRGAGLLPSEDGPSPDVWSKIEDAIADSDRRTVVVPIESGRRAAASTRRRIVRAVGIAAAAAAVVVLALWGVDTIDQSYSPSPAADLRRAAEEALRADGARSIVLTTPDGSTVELVLLPDGHGYVVRGDLPRSEDALYWLVGLTDDGPVVLARIGDRITPTAFLLPPSVTDLVLELGDEPGGERLASTSAGAAAPSAPSGSGSSATEGTDGSTPPAAGPSAPPAPPTPPVITLPSLPLPISLPPLDLSLF